MQTKPRKYTAPYLIAFHLGCDMRDVTEGRYQRYTAPNVYVCGSYYYACPAGSQKLPDLGSGTTQWEKVGTYYERNVFRTLG
jgi:hypothetical protein